MQTKLHEKVLSCMKEVLSWIKGDANVILNHFRIRFTGDLVTACPDVSQVALGSDEECVILASDGLWDYINRFRSLMQ